MRLRAPFVGLACLALFAPAFGQNENKSTDKPDPAIVAVRKTGAHVLPIAQDDQRLDVAYHLSQVKLTPEIFEALAGVKDRLYSLNLRGTNLNDELARGLAPLTELVRLHLEKTAITDAGLSSLAGMQKLEYLNLYGTRITDAGLKKLAGLKSLKKLYVWQTDVTLEGVHALEAALPKLRVIGGPPEPPEPVVAQRPVKIAVESSEEDAKKDEKKPAESEEKKSSKKEKKSAKKEPQKEEESPKEKKKNSSESGDKKDNKKDK